MPVTHTSDISRDRCILLYCLLTGRTINLGHMIYNHMLRLVNDKYKLGFPSLITELARHRGIVIGEQEFMTPYEPTINDEVVKIILTRRVKRRQHQRPPQQQPQPQPPPPHPTVATEALRHTSTT